MRRFVAGLLVLVSALSVVLASTSLWIRQNVIDTEVFIGNVETMVDLPEVEARINERVTATVMENPQVQDAIDEAVAVLPDRLQQFRPSVESGIRSVVSAGVQRLLSNDPFRPLTSAALTSAHDQLVNGQPVEFTLGMAKERVPDSARDGIAGQVLDLLPDDAGVTILTPADAPQVYSAIDLLKSAWWWLGLLALGTLAGALGVSRRPRGTLRAWAVTTTVLALLVLITLRVTRGLLLPQARPENRDAVGAIYDVLAGSLRVWTLWLLGAALLVLLVTLIWGRLGLVAGTRRGVATARARLAARRQAAAAGAVAVDADGAAVAVPAGDAEESWTRRVAAWARGFADGLDLPQRAAGLGALVRDHQDRARWGGIAVGALLLLFWPEPTLSVLIWIVALVGLYLGTLRWLVDRAPAQVSGGAGAVPPGVPVARGAADDALLAPSAVVPSPGQPQTDGAGNGVPAVVATAVETHPGPIPEPRASDSLVPAALTPETISTLNDRLDLLVRLGAARDAGVLTEDEFGREKNRLLGASCCSAVRRPRSTAATNRRSTRPIRMRSPTIWIVTSTRARSLTALMSPKPTVEKTVTTKYRLSIRLIGSVKAPGSLSESTT